MIGPDLYNPPSQHDPLAAAAGLLGQNEPNPFSGETEIRYRLPPSTADASIIVYDLFGDEVAVLELNLSSTIVSFDARDLHEGVYSYVLIADGRPVDARKMILTTN